MDRNTDVGDTVIVEVDEIDTHTPYPVVRTPRFNTNLKEKLYLKEEDIDCDP